MNKIHAELIGLARRALTNKSADSERIGVDDDLWAAGMDSLSSVEFMIAIEDAYGIEFPDQMLSRATFASVRTIADAVAGLLPSDQETGR